MSPLRPLCVALLVSVAAFAADTSNTASAPLELRGVLRMGADQRFSLCTVDSARTAWLAIGESFEGWKLVSYQADKETLTLSKDGVQCTVHMLAGSVGQADQPATKATLADAEDVIRKMNFNQMMQRVIEQQKKMAVTMSKQMAARMGQQVDDKEMAEYQEKVMNLMFSPETIEQMKSDLTQIYSDVFTKEELRNISDFYSTTTGLALVDKQPVVQEKFAAAMMPRIMAVMPQIQQLGQEFAAKIAAKKAAAQQAQAPALLAAPAPAATPAAPAPAPATKP